MTRAEALKAMLCDGATISHPGDKYFNYVIKDGFVRRATKRTGDIANTLVKPKHMSDSESWADLQGEGRFELVEKKLTAEEVASFFKGREAGALTLSVREAYAEAAAVVRKNLL